MTYKHRQIGYVIQVSMCIAAVFAAGISCCTARPLIPWALSVICVLTVFLFGSLTIEITDKKLKWSFGIGLVRKNIDMANVTSVEPVKNPWLYGWGIHLTPHGWLYNVSGWEAVQIRLKNGKQFRLGTDEPEALAGAITSAMGTS